MAPTKHVPITVQETGARPSAPVPLNPALATGSFADYPCNKHTSFWGIFEWPHDCYDHSDPNNPRHVLKRYTPKKTQAAETFINIYELRHLLYKHIVANINKTDVKDYAGLSKSCKTINKEMKASPLECRIEYASKQRKYWSKHFKANILIAEPTTYNDRTRISLPHSLFELRTPNGYDDEDIPAPPSRDGIRLIPHAETSVAAFAMSHLEITTHDDTTGTARLPADLDERIYYYLWRLSQWMENRGDPDGNSFGAWDTPLQTLSFRWDAMWWPDEELMVDVKENVLTEMQRWAPRWHGRYIYEEIEGGEGRVVKVGVMWTRKEGMEVEEQFLEEFSKLGLERGGV